MESKNITYYNEISMMMYGFGDSHEPNPETVRLVESIVQKQLQIIVTEALKYSTGDILKAENLIFLLRHNKYKMRRFVRYLYNKDLTKKVRETNSEIIEIEPEAPKNKFIDFIEMLDETGEFMDTSELDEVKMDRLIRADRIAQELNEKKYYEFQKARCKSFKRAGMDNIRLWIDPQQQIKFTPEALDVLCYFAFQTVAELIDFAFLIREDTRSDSDPLRHLTGSYYTACMFNGSHRFEGKKPDYTRVYSGQPPISPNEIKEVMRRIYSPQAGKLNFGGPVPDTHYCLAL